MAAPKPQPKTFDDAKLAMMVEPFTVRIEKIRGAQRTPIDLPPPEDPETPQNGGLTKEEIRNLESFISTQWTGGGFYEITVTDSSSPAPQKMTWQPYFDPQLFAERRTPTREEAAAGVTPIVQLPVQQPQQRVNMAYPNGFPQYTPTMHPLAQPGVPNAYSPYPPMPAAPPVGTNAWQAYSAEIDKRKAEDEMHRLREENAKRDREAQEARHRAELDREKQANEQRTRALEAQMSGLQQMFSNALNEMKSLVTTNRPNAEVEQLRMQMVATEARLEREQRERESERREAAIRDLIRSTTETTQRQIETLTRQFEERTRALTEAGKAPDAMMTMLRENAREHSETVKELSRNAQAQLTGLQAQMMRPQDVLQMALQASQAAEGNNQKIAGAYANVLEMHKGVLEQALQLQPQGSGVVDVVRDGVNGLKDFAERYVGAKSAETRMVAQAQVEIAQANAQVMAVQAAAASGQPIVVQGAAAPVTPAPAAQALPEGTAQRSVMMPKPKRTEGMDGIQPIEGPPPQKRHGRTDREWFGPAIEEVLTMRESVKLFIDKLSENPANPPTQPNGRHFGTNPEEAALGIIAAVQTVVANNIAVAAVIDLLMPGKYLEFVDVLLPNAPDMYRFDVVNILKQKIAILSGEAPPEPARPPVQAQVVEDDDGGDDAGDGDGEDEHGDDAEHDGKIVAAPRSVVSIVPPQKSNKAKPAPAPAR